MSRDLEFIKSEKDVWGKVFVDISYGIDNVAPFLSEQTLKIRKYHGKVDILKKYISLLDSAEMEASKASSSFLVSLKIASIFPFSPLIRMIIERILTN